MAEKVKKEAVRILVTGAEGMIGRKMIDRLLTSGYKVVGLDRVPQTSEKKGYTYIQMDLDDKSALEEALKGLELTHIVHLAALAHTEGVDDLSWEQYYRINVTCAENVFSVASCRGIPVLFASTADVYGIADTAANANSERNPIGNYAKSKCMAENSLMQICKNSPYTIMRFAPVYTREVQRDIRKRYYLRYPNLAYKVGKGVEYEVLNIENLVKAAESWVEDALKQQVINVKDEEHLKTTDRIKSEKDAGRAKFVLWIPRWLMLAAFTCLRRFRPMGYKTYMLSKVVKPLRTE